MEGKLLGKGIYGRVLTTKDKDRVVKVQTLKDGCGVSNAMTVENEILRGCRHPHIVQVYDVQVTQDPNTSQLSVCTVMERCDESFNDWIKKQIVPLQKQDATSTTDVGLHPVCQQLLDYFYQLLLALEYLHRHHIIHGDLKAQNVMLKNGLLKLIDFGLAQHILNDQPRRKLIQTSWFRAPEVILEYPYYDEVVEMWSFGVMLMKATFGFLISSREDKGKGVVAIQILVDYLEALGIPQTEQWKRIIEQCIKDCDPRDKTTPALLRKLAPFANSSDHANVSTNKYLLQEYLQQYPKRLAKTTTLFGDSFDALVDLLAKCFEIDPAKRIHACQALLHPLFAKSRERYSAPLPVENAYSRVPTPLQNANSALLGEVEFEDALQLLEYQCREQECHPNSYLVAASVLKRISKSSTLSNLPIPLPLLLLTVLILAVTHIQGHFPTVTSSKLQHLQPIFHFPDEYIPLIVELQLCICQDLDWIILDDQTRSELAPFINYFDA